MHQAIKRIMFVTQSDTGSYRMKKKHDMHYRKVIATYIHSNSSKIK